MDHFLCEVFDVLNVNDIPDIKSVFDGSKKLMVYHKIYEHPVIISNIIFTFCYKECLGIYPSKLEVQRFQDHIRDGDKQRINLRALDFMAKNTFYKHISHLKNKTPPEILKLSDQFVDEMKSDKDNMIKMLIATKLRARLCPAIEVIVRSRVYDCESDGSYDNDFDRKTNDIFLDNKDTLFVLYSRLIAVSGLNINKFYETNIDMIKRDELLIKNVFSDFRLFPLSEDKKKLFSLCQDSSTMTITDAISYQLNNDYCFQRLVMTRPCITCYIEDGYPSEFIDMVREAVVKTHDGAHEAVCIFGRFNDLSSICCTSQDRDGTGTSREKEGTTSESVIPHSDPDASKNTGHSIKLYTSNSRLFSSCVPKIMGTFISIISPDESSTDTDRYIEPKSINGSDISFNLGKKKVQNNEIEYYQIATTNLDITTSKVMMIPYLTNPYPNPHPVNDGSDDLMNYREKSRDENNSFDFQPNSLLCDKTYADALTRDFLVMYLRSKVASSPRDKHMTNAICPARNYILKYMAQNSLSTWRFRENEERKRKRDCENCILYIDNRPNIQGVNNIVITMSNLEEENWNVVIMTSEKNGVKEFYREHLGSHVEFIHSRLLESSKFNIEHYNTVMKDEKTWDALLLLGYKKCLIIQDDSLLLRKGMEDMFLRYDYVGPPWRKGSGNEPLFDYVSSNFVGNGGISLRTIDMMSKICKTYRNEKNILFNGMLQVIPEDVYFSMTCRLMGCAIPSYEEASLFAIEQVFNEKAFGIHKFWVYNKRDDVIRYFVSVLIG